MAMSRVSGDDEIYVGGIFTLRRTGALQAAGITHIVSVLIYDFKDFQDWEKYQHCSVPVNDVEDENLLEHFPRTNKFIGDALRTGGKVFIHCAMGKSRSVTITLAHLLSTRPDLNLQSALHLVRETRSIAEPNDGFMAQLALYESMKCPVDVESHPAYQRWLYQRDVELSVATGRAPDRLRFEDEEVQSSDLSSLVLDDGKPDMKVPEKELRCKRCRRALATTQYLIPHPPKKSNSSNQIDYSPISTLPKVQTLVATSSLPSECTHHFIHPLSWMREELEKAELSGRLECPNAKCKSLVGRYAWQGMRCSCGEWVVPGFSLQGGRVDEVVKGQKAIAGPTKSAAGGIRVPPGMRMPPTASAGKGNL